jgi:hypothetical protein
MIVVIDDTQFSFVYLYPKGTSHFKILKRVLKK